MTQSVAELCQQQNVSLEQLVERSGLDRERLTAILLGRWTPSPAERQSLAEVFGVAKDDITWGHATPIQHLYGHGPG